MLWDMISLGKGGTLVWCEEHALAWILAAAAEADFF